MLYWPFPQTFFFSNVLTIVGEPEPITGIRAFLEGAGAGFGKEIYKNSSPVPSLFRESRSRKKPVKTALRSRESGIFRGAEAEPGLFYREPVKKGARSPTLVLTIPPTISSRQKKHQNKNIYWPLNVYTNRIFSFLRVKLFCKFQKTLIRILHTSFFTIK